MRIRVAVPASIQVSGGDANGVGVFTATCSGAVDKAGNAAEMVSATFNVVYDFSGFTPPVENPPVFNSANAGQTVPLSWRIADANGNPVTSLTSITVTAESLDCSLDPTPDQLEERSAAHLGCKTWAMAITSLTGRRRSLMRILARR